MIIVCGEALIDLVPTSTRDAYIPRPGGGPANVAVALGRLGQDVALLTRLPKDHFGRLLRDHLLQSNVDLSFAAETSEQATLAVVNLETAGDADYSFYLDNHVDAGWCVEELPARLPANAALHVSGSLALAVPLMGDTLEVLIRREHPHRVITFDPNPRPALTTDPAELRARLHRWLALADIVKVSADDLAWTMPGQSIEEVAQQWHDEGPTLVIITRGAAGVYALGPAGRIALTGATVRIVDTVGAGDAFMAGLLAALNHANLLNRDRLARISGAEQVNCLHYAQHVAEITCGRAGADPPWLSEL